MNFTHKATVVMCVVLAWAGISRAAIITETFNLAPSGSGGPADGLSAQATFVLNTAEPWVLRIRLVNTSTGVPPGFDSADQILTSVAFDLGAPGPNDADPRITTGAAHIGPGGRSIGFDKVVTQLGPGDDVSGEWGYGNGGGTGLLLNFVSANTAGANRFSQTNLDGPASLDGPECGIVTDPPQASLGGLGVIADSVDFTLTLNAPLSDLDFLTSNKVRVEFGSDAAFLEIPEPVTVWLLALGAIGIIARRKRA